MNELALFAGAGGGLLASKWMLGWKTICYVEWNKYCISTIQVRIRDGIFDDAPIWDDVQTFNGKPWTGLVDIITAGFPCQPFAIAGKRLGEDDERNMWPATLRVIREVQPPLVLLENVPTLRCPRRKKDHPKETKASYFGRILGDLAESRYDARWKVLSAAEVGAPHKRDRVFVLAYSKQTRLEGQLQYMGSQGEDECYTSCEEWRIPEVPTWWATEPALDRVAHGVANRQHRIESIGNGQVPAVVATVWKLLTQRHGIYDNEI